MLAGYMQDSAAIGHPPEHAQRPSGSNHYRHAIVDDALLASLDSVIPVYPEIIGRLIAR